MSRLSALICASIHSPHRMPRCSVTGANRGRGDESPVHWKIRKIQIKQCESDKVGGKWSDGGQETVPVLSEFKNTRQFFPVGLIHALEVSTIRSHQGNLGCCRRHQRRKANAGRWQDRGSLYYELIWLDCIVSSCSWAVNLQKNDSLVLFLYHFVTSLFYIFMGFCDNKKQTHDRPVRSISLDHILVCTQRIRTPICRFFLSSHQRYDAHVCSGDSQ